MSPMHHEVGKWVKSVAIIASIVVAWLQGEKDVTLNWSAIAAFFSGGTMLGLLMLVFKGGRWAGEMTQRVADLEQKIEVIDSRGCGVATRFHSNESEN